MRRAAQITCAALGLLLWTNATQAAKLVPVGKPRLTTIGDSKQWAQTYRVSADEGKKGRPYEVTVMSPYGASLGSRSLIDIAHSVLARLPVGKARPKHRPTSMYQAILQTIIDTTAGQTGPRDRLQALWIEGFELKNGTRSFRSRMITTKGQQRMVFGEVDLRAATLAPSITNVGEWIKPD